MTYSEKLQHPQWQKKRLQIMSRDGFQCVKCSSETNTLTVHHFYYVSGRMPWEYPGGSMATMCRKCHFEGHEDSHSFPTFFTSWELSACCEIKRQIQMSQQDIDHDKGVLFLVEKAGQESGWPPFETMHLLKDAAELGIMTTEWLSDLSKQVAAIQKQQASNQ
jgi:hypothetical protein